MHPCTGRLKGAWQPAQKPFNSCSNSDRRMSPRTGSMLGSRSSGAMRLNGPSTSATPTLAGCGQSRRLKIVEAGQTWIWPTTSRTMPAFSPITSVIESQSGPVQHALVDSLYGLCCGCLPALPDQLQRFSESSAHTGARAGRGAPRSKSSLSQSNGGELV